jgi:DNA-binding response OmpR family regulator
MCPTRVLYFDHGGAQRASIIRFRGMLKKHQYVVTNVESEDQAVDTFRRGGIDVVILDYQHPQGKGLHCLRRLRRLDAIVPVIAVSGIATQAIAAELIEAGADDYLSTQLIDKQILSESIQTVLTRARGIRARVGAAAPPGR